MNKKQEIIDSLLNRGVIKTILPTREDLEKKLNSEEKLKIYIGADPTSGALHLSHAKNYMVLEEFRQLGHEVYVLIGDFTARIGDPTEKSTARKQLSREDVNENVKSWLRQIKPLMDFEAKDNPPKVVYNHDWLSKLTMEEVVNLASNFTVQQMLERDMFEKRMDENKPIFLHEFLYPLMQGYDSVALEVDIELCGTDQIFNALAGRTLLKKLKNKDKFVVAVNLMENPVNGELMSKSRGTGIFLDFSPEDMYGGIMAQPDEMIKVFLVNNTRLPLAEIDKLLAEENPRDAKMKTAKIITAIFHGEELAQKAEDYFISKIQKKEAPDDVEEISLGLESETLLNILKKALPDMSGGELKRLISQNAVRLDGEVRTDEKETINLNKEGMILNVGKRTWLKIKA
ncbi:tyrosine--tRNA ligase [Candidatus Falkowbacteria bacterium]|nr:tyrosine--tRNA ligase [Candidatus Falkowbacteria bacterium]NCT54656.1 tyrosine--tRNA ligase [Candidatus Falkowbacteria bacterium]